MDVSQVGARAARLATLDGVEAEEAFAQATGSVDGMVPYLLQSGSLAARAAAVISANENCCMIVKYAGVIGSGGWQRILEALLVDWNRIVSGETFELRRVAIAAIIDGVAERRWGDEWVIWLCDVLSAGPAYLREIDGKTMCQELKRTRCKGMDAEAARRAVAFVGGKDGKQLRELFLEANTVARRI